MGTNTDKEKNFNEIESQLHEQYATNNTNNLGAVVSLMAGLFVVIGFYGNVFISSSYYFEKAGDCNYRLSDLCIAAACAYIALGIMAYICIYQGMHQRHEQFIVWAIRNKFYGDKYNNPKIFSDDYVPFGKNGFRIIQGLYGEFVKIISLVTGCITISLLAKIGYNIYKLYNNGWSHRGVIMCAISLVAYILVYIICVNRFRKGEIKYRNLSNEYGHLLHNDQKPIIIKPSVPEPFKEISCWEFFKNFFIAASLFKVKDSRKNANQIKGVNVEKHENSKQI